MNVTRLFDGDTDRYAFDFKLCQSKDGWAQVDTKQDASYYGNWANPLKLQLVSYAEGDITVTKCDTDAEFTAAVTEMCEWQKTAGYFKGIDSMCSDDIKAGFARTNLNQYLWPDSVAA